MAEPLQGMHDRTAHVALAAILLIVAATLITFSGILSNGFAWDDFQSLVRNDRYRGLDGQHLRWMFTTSLAGHYQPLSWLTFAVETRIWGGVSAIGFHFTNLLLHLVTSVTFFLATLRLLAYARREPANVGMIVAACAGALLFSVHPLRVESVAWATERRDVLSGALLMLTLLLYLRAVGPLFNRTRTGGTKPSPKRQRGVDQLVACAGSREDSDRHGISPDAQRETPRRRRPLLILSFICFGLSLLSKASGITFPLVLFVLDVYPLRRLRQAEKGSRRRVLSQVLREKLLYAAVAAPIAFLALWAQSEAGALRSVTEHPLGLRIGQALYGIMFYLSKSLWPAQLIPLYEQNPAASPFDAANVVSGLLVLAVFVFLWKQRRRWPALWSAWLIYVIVLLPMLGLAQSGPQVVADRYSYLSCMPWAVLLAGWIAHVWNRHGPSPLRKRLTLASPLVLAIGWLAILTSQQTHIWADNYTLWSAVVQRAPDTGTAHANLAVALNNHGRYEAARGHALDALRILPGNRVAHLALARACSELNDLETAETHFATALAIRPNDITTMLNLVHVEMRLGHHGRAEQLCRSAIREAPGSAVAHFDLGSLLARRAEYEDARDMFQEAIRLDPAYSLARYRLAIVQLKLSEPAAAIATLEEGLTHDPSNTLIRAKLVWILATCTDASLRDGARALRLAKRAMEADGGGSPADREAWAAALAENGSFNRAAEVISTLLSKQDPLLPEEARRRLEAQRSSYLHKKPIRE